MMLTQQFTGTAVTRMLNLRDVLQLVNHCFDDRPLAREQSISQPGVAETKDELLKSIL